MTYLDEFTQKVKSAGSFADMVDAFSKVAIEKVGAKLFTLTRIDYQGGVAERIYSNMPNAYPVSGTKPLIKDKWSEQVLDQQQIFRSNSIEGLAEVFSDYELIHSLDCASVLNFPINCAGQVIGTVNFLHEADFYDEGKEALAQELYLPALTCFLTQSYLERTTNG